MEITITEFKEQYLPNLREQFQMAVQKSLIRNSTVIAEKLEKQIETFVYFVGNFQKEIPVALGEIQIALLYTSVCMQEPQICISAYGKNKLLGEEILNIKYHCDWLFTEWDSYQKKIEEKVQEIHAESYIRRAAVKMMMNESIPFLISCLYTITKYQFMEFDRVKDYQELLLTEDFRVTVGGYRDWCRMIYRVRPETDIFLSEQNTPLSYCVFRGAVYNQKKFTKLDLSHARFYECEFVHCEFTDVKLQDSIFENCRMYHCSFQETTFYGATFRQSTLKKNHAEGVKWQYEPDLEEIEDIYKEVEFIECVNDGSVLECEKDGNVLKSEGEGGMLGDKDDGSVCECEKDGNVLKSEGEGGMLGDKDDGSVCECEKYSNILEGENT